MEALKRLAGKNSPLQSDDLQSLLGQIPYTSYLDLRVTLQSNQLTVQLPFRDDLVGNENLRALHGGVVGAVLESTCVLALLAETACNKLPKTISMSFDYLRATGPRDAYCQATVTRLGRRVANVEAQLWQDDASKPASRGHGNFLLEPLGQG